jgi:7,8-dihydropterin-6-yl-methyl-4-(beta-D-ribofuranosyl)aminobenzene 5'-phosphate synthase
MLSSLRARGYAGGPGASFLPDIRTAPVQENGMKLTILVDNNTLIDRYFFAEPGISLYIEEGGKRFLFDVGYSDIFIRNAQKMNIDLRMLDYVVLSHGHLDHTWGLDPLVRLYTESDFEHLAHRRPAILAHPLAFMPKKSGRGAEIGSMISQESLSRHFPINLSAAPLWLTENLLYLGAIERKTGFEGKGRVGTVVKPDGEEPDNVQDDTALVYRSHRGLVIITGCSHSGICNIVEQAKKICREEKVFDIVGGLHLLNPSDEQLRGTVEYLRKLSPDSMHACHCTDLRSKIALSKVVNLKEVGVGLTLEYD